jgi:dihydroorotate dehydrogenase
MYKLARPLLFRLDPERAHRCTLAAIRLLGNIGSPDSRPAPIELLNLRFANRVGLAAGFDKDAEALDGIWRLGFGFAEIGTITPRAQSGKPRPRLFRLPRQLAIINSMGFPNQGLEAISARLRRRRPSAGVLGVSIGKNADTPLPRAVDDYLACLRGVHELADYIAVNISSPNTESLRELHDPDKLGPLLRALVDARESGRLICGKRPPLLLKISPDLDVAALESVASTVSNARFDGVIATNSTVQRTSDISEGAPDGGLSGAPLRSVSIGAVAHLRKLLGPAFPIVGVGGIDSPATAMAMYNAGADLIQLYTGLVYRGPRLVRECQRVARSEPAQ